MLKKKLTFFLLLAICVGLFHTFSGDVSFNVPLSPNFDHVVDEFLPPSVDDQSINQK